MKKILVLLALVVCSMGLTSCHGGGHPFDEQFDGTSLNTNAWILNWYGGSGPTNPPNGEMDSCWSPSNVTVSGGQLHLSLTSPDCIGYPYTGSGVVSRTPSSFAWKPPMRFEASVRFPGAPNFHNWGALWVTASGTYGTCAGWPYGGEFDVAEVLGGQLRAVTHYSSNGTCSGGNSDAGSNQSQATTNDGLFHTYRVDLSAGSSSCSSPFTSVRIQYSKDNTYLPPYERCINVSGGWDIVLQHSTGTWGGTSVAPAVVDVDWVTVTTG
jgi:hypothetical protein